ncbi:MAG: hypothetical protein RBT42_03050 [Aquabacterium sp.]|uniref:hypothetical protein n=1 Tax=Aquabacterium sp. TaxID=1872578 RepID=UPI002A364B24|nr:hypothetical protein [Aquabacterium sp.]MDX9842709.1 hypothetical protein [Aquabacterium sp.]
MTNNSLRAAQVLWPAFVMAGVLEMLLFSVLDPATLSFGNWHPEPATVYSLAFFVFWALIAAAAAASQWMAGAAQRGNSSDGEAPHQRRRRSRHGTAQHV